MGISKNKNLTSYDERSIYVNKEENGINECYNALKDNILFMNDGKGGNVYQVESSVIGEGKTTLTCNLGVSLSFNAKKVLIVDLDFRRPRVNRVFNFSNDNGIVDYLSEKISFETMIKKTEYKGLDVVTRGSEIFNSSFLLTSGKFKEFIEKVRGLYDYVLLDCPPILLVSDYIHVSKHSDGVLFVVAYGKTKRKQLVDASNLLKKDNVKVFASVMTFVDKTSHYSFYYGAYTDKPKKSKK